MIFPIRLEGGENVSSTRQNDKLIKIYLITNIEAKQLSHTEWHTVFQFQNINTSVSADPQSLTLAQGEDVVSCFHPGEILIHWLG